jgi:chemotaxis protein MotB
MRRKYIEEENTNHERWLISYADFITLLFGFFVVLFASTYRDNQEIRKLARAITDGFQSMGAFTAGSTGKTGLLPDSGNDSVHALQPQADQATAAAEARMLDLKRQLEVAMGKELANHEMALQVTPQGFVISLKELGFFNSGQAKLLPGADAKIVRIARVLAQRGLEIRIEGHSDDQPIHNAQFSSNWDLSAARAMTVLFLLANQGGFDPANLSASGYGQYRPEADNSTPEGRRMNRRVDIVVIDSHPRIVSSSPARGSAHPPSGPPHS